MWFETLTSLELDRLIEFEATHCLIVAAVKGARLIMYLRVPGFEKNSLFQIWERKMLEEELVCDELLQRMELF